MKTLLITALFFLSLLSCLAPKEKNITSQQFLLKWDRFFISELGYENAPLNNLENINHIQFNRHKADSLDPFLYETRNGLKFSSSSIELFYYAVLDTTDYYSVLYFSFNESNEQCYDLVNYSKNYEIIDFYRGVSCFGGDGEYFYEVLGEFANDSIINQQDNEGEYEYDNIKGAPAKKNYTTQKKYKLKIEKNGNIIKN